MRTAQIIVDILALIAFSVGLYMGKEECSTWIVIIWVVIAIIDHVALKEYEDNH